MRVFAWSKRKREKFFLDRPIRAFRNGWTRLGAFGAGFFCAWVLRLVSGRDWVEGA